MFYPFRRLAIVLIISCVGCQVDTNPDSTGERDGYTEPTDPTVTLNPDSTDTSDPQLDDESDTPDLDDPSDATDAKIGRAHV